MWKKSARKAGRTRKLTKVELKLLATARLYDANSAFSEDNKICQFHCREGAMKV
jgi:hypothetical protein